MVFHSAAIYSLRPFLSLRHHAFEILFAFDRHYMKSPQRGNTRYPLHTLQRGHAGQADGLSSLPRTWGPAPGRVPSWLAPALTCLAWVGSGNGICLPVGKSKYVLALSLVMSSYIFQSSGKMTFRCEHRVNDRMQLWFQKQLLWGYQSSLGSCHQKRKAWISEFCEFHCLLGRSQIAVLSREGWGLEHLLLAASHSFTYYWNSILAMTSWRQEVSEIALSRKMRVDAFFNKYVEWRLLWIHAD